MIFYPGELVQFIHADYCPVPSLAWQKFVVLLCTDMQANTYTIALSEYVQLTNIQGEFLCKSK